VVNDALEEGHVRGEREVERLPKKERKRSRGKFFLFSSRECSSLRKKVMSEEWESDKKKRARVDGARTLSK